MKKIVSLILAMSILSALFALTSYATTPAVTLSATSTVRAGDTVKITVKVSGDKLLGATFQAVYDESKLTYSGSSSHLKDWKVEESSKSGVTAFLCYEDTSTQTSYIDGTATMCVLTFKVSSKLSEGDSISVKITDIQLTDGENESTPSNALYSVKLAKPLSSDSKLSSLSIKGFELNENFSSSKTEYTATVNYDTESIELDTSRNDKSSSVKISGTSGLEVGKNTVSVKVTAEDGSSTTYKITVTRPDDPNKSDDSSLSSIELSTGALEPKFEPGVFEYTVNVDRNVEKITLTPKATNIKATTVGGTYDLQEGENVLEIKCTSEKGTVSTYKITVNRATGDSIDTSDVTDTGTGFVTDDMPADTGKQTDDTTNDYIADTTERETDSSEQNKSDGKQSNILLKSVPLWLTVLIALLTMIFGMVCGYLVYGRT